MTTSGLTASTPRNCSERLPRSVDAPITSGKSLREMSGNSLADSAGKSSGGSGLISFVQRTALAAGGSLVSGTTYTVKISALTYIGHYLSTVAGFTGAAAAGETAVTAAMNSFGFPSTHVGPDSCES